MNEVSLTFTIWLSWGLVGLIMGYMVARLTKPKGLLWANVLVGILAAIGGGWCFVYLFGATEKMVYASLLVALGVSVLFLWILSKLKGKSR
ncbi:MAG: GlsB/YeaQ/YmgE family stress response membrane protein [Muribaculaceae bacterium]|jgi:hypothetical protein|nr:GlsB/YeaQ/YmgE family stress response membrane protein [Muribaculaceae bacterium]